MKTQLVDAPARLRAHVYAIIRVETDTDFPKDWANRVTVVRVVADPGYADAEVERLNALNASKGCCYFKQLTRYENPPMEKALSAVDLGSETLPSDHAAPSSAEPRV